MERRVQNRLRRLGGAMIAIALVVGMGWAFLEYRRSGRRDDEQPVPITKIATDHSRKEPEFLELSQSMVQAMRLTTAVAAVPRFSKVLHLRGSLAIDPNRLSHVHARFPGQIVELATIKGFQSQQSDQSLRSARLLQNFDSVGHGTPLAVIWSKDLGEKKSQLADSLAKLRTDKKTLENYRELTKSSSISDRQFREQQTKVEQGEIAAFTAEATLRAYQVSEEDIKQVKTAAEMIHRSEATDKSYATDWPRVIVTAPIGGVIVDKLVNVGDIVDANAELFKIADLSTLAVYLHSYEEDLAGLEDLPKPLQVSIKVPAHPELGTLEGTVDRFSPMIDPNEHMALLIGTVKNPRGALLANQFITADVGIPVEPGIVEIPANAVIDIGNEAIAYVQPDVSKPVYHRRRVSVVQRYFDVVYVRSEIKDDKKNLNEIQVGDAVIAGGLLELEDYLQQQE
jgi:cobalt-zinc-cadmium efflux system membrane fusion protein